MFSEVEPDDLLRYGRPRPLELRLVDLDAIADLAISTARQGLGAQAAEVRIDRVKGATTPIEADQGQLSQLLVILVENALLAARSALRVSTLPDGERLRLRVEDDGAGIPPELLPRLFRPFVTGRPRGNGRSGP